jgi:hypothetical protein
MKGRQTDTGRMPPVAGFGWAPAEASTHDTVRFYDYSYDPGRQGIARRRWDFGDGTGSDEARPEHRYAADGAYTATLAVWTIDGRSGSHAVSLRVRTRHVAITSFTAPDRCPSEQLVDVTIGITSAQVDEIVDVVLVKRSVGEPSPVEQLGRSTVVVRGGRFGGETPVTIPVAFSAADAKAGSVALEATVSVLPAREPYPVGHNASAVVHVTVD